MNTEYDMMKVRKTIEDSSRLTYSLHFIEAKKYKNSLKPMNLERGQKPGLYHPPDF